MKDKNGGFYLNSHQDLEKFLIFFYVHLGRLYKFKNRDLNDYDSCFGRIIFFFYQEEQSLYQWPKWPLCEEIWTKY